MKKFEYRHSIKWTPYDVLLSENCSHYFIVFFFKENDIYLKPYLNFLEFK